MKESDCDKIVDDEEDKSSTIKYHTECNLTNLNKNDYGYDVTYEYMKTSKKKNKINVLVINFGNTFNYTISAINDLLMQTSDFDLTLIDNNGYNFKRTQVYFEMLYDNWNFKNRSLHIIGLCKPVALNHLWNSFYHMTNNEWLCFLNNDVGIPVNFISDNEEVIGKEFNAGIINHATNKLDIRRSNKLIYKVYEKDKKNFLHRQGWDFTMSRRYFTEIPQEFTTFVGDDILFYGVYKNNADVIFLYSSPIIHYRSSS